MIDILNTPLAAQIAQCLVAQARLPLDTLPYEDFNFTLEALEIDVDHIRLVIDGNEYFVKASKE